MLADKRDELDEVKRAKARMELRTAPWDERVAPFKREITDRQNLIDEAAARHVEAVRALDAWLTGELTSAPDYDPERPEELPPAVVSVLVHLDDAIERTARIVGAAQASLQERFGAAPHGQQSSLVKGAAEFLAWSVSTVYRQLKASASWQSGRCARRTRTTPMKSTPACAWSITCAGASF